MEASLSPDPVVSRSTRPSGERLELALAAAGLGTFEWCEGQFSGSARTFEILGLPSAQGCSFEEACARIHPDERGPVIAALYAAIREDHEFSVEGRVVWSDGSVHWLLASGRTSRDPAGRLRAVGVLREITQEKAAEAELQKAVRARDTMISLSSHELLTPITSMKLQLDLMKRAIERKDPAAYEASRVNRLVLQTEAQLERLHRLVHEMLDLSRIDLGKLVLKTREFDLSALVLDVTERQLRELRAAGCTLDVAAEPGLTGSWDPYRVEQVIAQLLANAARYAHDTAVRVSLRREGERAVLEVLDHGPGIAPADHERIFERFVRAVNLDQGNGLGIGLYLVKQVVEAHGGTVRVESELGRGAKFVVTLPFPKA